MNDNWIGVYLIRFLSPNFLTVRYQRRWAHVAASFWAICLWPTYYDIQGAQRSCQEEYISQIKLLVGQRQKLELSSRTLSVGFQQNKKRKHDESFRTYKQEESKHHTNATVPNQNKKMNDQRFKIFCDLWYQRNFWDIKDESGQGCFLRYQNLSSFSFFSIFVFV